MALFLKYLLNLFNQVFKDRKWLGSISYSSGEMKYPDNVDTENDEKVPNYQVHVALSCSLIIPNTPFY